ncbi:hypothetical protein EI427_25265 [Flammeovirga pectinis]|uniref:Uncharacterized protein n=1 Tax=Flammeovirga pectinis TaxID=2494373 RepID=A0A3Q9FVW2_9BACT|nr:hypothetical protein EI427_25265 [Flammeovirga pectinis]
MSDYNTINAFTLSGNINLGPLRVIPELRRDTSDMEIFLNHNNKAVNSANQTTIAVVYEF